MKPYGQYCGVARALDVVGERWSLLVVRELLVRPCRFTDLLDGLPGVARNLLAERLRTLQDAGVVAHDGARYSLTAWGRGLEPVLRELVRWSVPLMVTGRGEDAVRGRWIGAAAEALFHGADLAGLNGLVVGVDVEGEAATLLVEPSGVLKAAPGVPEAPGVVLRGSFEGVIAALTGFPSADPAAVEGDAGRLQTLAARFAPAT